MSKTKRLVSRWPLLRVTVCYGFLLLWLSIAVPAELWAAPSPSPVGWHWYNLPPTPLKKPSTPEKTVDMTTLSPTQKMAVMHGMTLQALNQAVLNPTEENLHTFVLWQNFWLHQAGQFTNEWKAMLLNHPDMDYAVRHPHENLTASIQAAQHHTEEDQAIQQLAAHNGFFFFYRGGNKLDQSLAPSLATFAREKHLALIAISMDGKVLPAFATSRVDHGQAKALGITHFPALLLINPTTRAITPVNYGFISMDELQNRLWHIAHHWQLEDSHE